ncbi:hypothetical protein HanLR1_Chr08g0273991 [Helianthus annuus]|nr:hypothetical protein HanLR1_Chr08g0273991 [Helianthus annuus]
MFTVYSIMVISDQFICAFRQTVLFLSFVLLEMLLAMSEVVFSSKKVIFG